MEDIAKSLKAFLYDRSSSPLFGAFLTGWSIWNYRFFLVILGGKEKTTEEVFAHIDRLYSEVYVGEFKDIALSIPGELVHGVLIPSALALAYIYLYPIFARPVYEYSLKKQVELREIKQKEERNRLLTYEESRRIHKTLAEQKAEHAEEIDRLRSENEGFREAIKNYEKRDLPHDRDGADEANYHKARLPEYVKSRRFGRFKIEDLIPSQEWEGMANAQRQELGRIFKGQVDEGLFPDIKAVEKDSENKQIYLKKDISGAAKSVLNLFSDKNEVSLEEILNKTLLSPDVIQESLNELHSVKFVSSRPQKGALHYFLLPNGRGYLLDQLQFPSSKISQEHEPI